MRSLSRLVSPNMVFPPHAVDSRSGCWVTFVILPSPQKESSRSTNPLELVRPTGAHFLHHGRSLIVSYLTHGIMYVCDNSISYFFTEIPECSAWDIHTRRKLWTIHPTHPHKFMYVVFHFLVCPSMCLLTLGKVRLQPYLLTRKASQSGIQSTGSISIRFSRTRAPAGDFDTHPPPPLVKTC